MALVILVVGVAVGTELGVEWEPYAGQLKFLTLYAIAWDWIK